MTIQEKFYSIKSDSSIYEAKTVKLANGIELFDHLIHLYTPLIYVGKGYEDKVKVIPVALNESEWRFVKDVDQQIDALKKEFEFDEAYLLRNQSKKGLGFFAEGNNFYPDFILWIKKEGIQYLTFVDPKGIRNSKGLSDPKIQFFNYLRNIVQPQVTKDNLVLNSFVLSNTRWLEIHWKESYSIHDFNNSHVLFQEDQYNEYIRILFSMILL